MAAAKRRREAMPLYEYECKKCHHRFEKIQKFSDPHMKKCPDCGGTVEQVISAPAVQFKGSGWYVTDYAKKSGSSGSSSSSSDGESPSKDSTAKDAASKDAKDSKDSPTKSDGKKESKPKPETKESKKAEKK
jgi:putative FmdB family regulatory protein